MLIHCTGKHVRSIGFKSKASGLLPGLGSLNNLQHVGLHDNSIIKNITIKFNRLSFPNGLLYFFFFLYSIITNLTMAAPMGHDTIKFNSNIFNSLRLLLHELLAYNFSWPGYVVPKWLCNTVVTGSRYCCHAHVYYCVCVVIGSITVHEKHMIW